MAWLVRQPVRPECGSGHHLDLMLQVRESYRYTVASSPAAATVVPSVFSAYNHDDVGWFRVTTALRGTT